MNYKIDQKMILGIIIILLILTIFILSISPILAYLICLIFLAMGVGVGIPPLRILLSLIAIFGMIFTVGSKAYNVNNSSDDFSNSYLPLYYTLNSSDLVSNVFSENYEYLLPILWRFINFINGGDLTPVGLMVYISGFSILLFYIWLELFGLKNIPDTRKTLCIAFSLGFFQFLMPIQYMRQFISLIFILYSFSLWDKNKKISFLFFILAFFSHISAILIFPLIKILFSNNKKIKNIIFIFFLILTLFYSVIFPLVAKLGSSGLFYKLQYYLEVSSDRSNTYGYFKFLFLALIASKFYFVDYLELQKYKNFLYSGTIIFIVLFPIPELPLRLMGILIYILIGYLIFLSTYRMGMISRYLFVFYVILMGYKCIVLDNYSRMVNTDADFMSLWYSYPWFGENFFYYLSYL